MNKYSEKLRIYFRPKINKKGRNSYLYCRLYFRGQEATDFSTYIAVNDHWSQANQVFIGKDDHIQELNDRLSDIRTELNYTLRTLSKSSIPTVRELRKKYLNYQDTVTILELSRKHLNTIKKRLGQKGYTRGTQKAHTTLHMHIENFLNYRRKNDITIDNITVQFGREFVEYLKYERKYSQNFVVKSVNYLKALLDQSVIDGKLEKNPLIYIKEEKSQPGEICYLTESEIELLKDSIFLSEPLTRVADAFLFQCFTGLSYCDLVKFSASDHIKEIKGRRIIQFARRKTDTAFTIPILSYTETLLSKYNGNIPIISNQKMNLFLKTIAKTVGIDKNITTHIGRKTAGTFLLNRDVPLEVVSKILGHNSVKTTQTFYAQILTDTLLRHTEHLT